jgi:pimeloyl-ACP methyl ester carboxylesterase
MPHLTTDDGVKLHYEEVGSGVPLIFVHEFAGDCRSWESQMRYFGRRYRASLQRAWVHAVRRTGRRREILAGTRARRHQGRAGRLEDRQSAHRRSLHGWICDPAFRFTYPERTLSLVVGGCGYGASADKRAQFMEETEAAARRFEEVGMSEAAVAYALAPSRVQFQNKDPRGWQEFADQLAGNSTRGAALTMRGVQKRRPSLVRPGRSHEDHHRADPHHHGDEDWPCLEPALLMKRTIQTAGLVVMPNTGHTINLEEPAAFNQHVADFLHAVDTGAGRLATPAPWCPRFWASSGGPPRLHVLVCAVHGALSGRALYLSIILTYFFPTATDTA